MVRADSSSDFVTDAVEVKLLRTCILYFSILLKLARGLLVYIPKFKDNERMVGLES